MQTWAQQFNVYFPLNGKMHKIQTANTSKILTWTSIRYCAFNCHCWNVLLCYSSGSLEITYKFINFRLLFQKSNESQPVRRKESVVSHLQSLITRIPMEVKVRKDTFTQRNNKFIWQLKSSVSCILFLSQCFYYALVLSNVKHVLENKRSRMAHVFNCKFSSLFKCSVGRLKCCTYLIPREKEWCS